MDKILVVEDEYAIRELIALNLTRAGYDVFRAPSAERALEIYEESPTDFQLALLDIMLPNMDGITLCKRIRESNQNIGIILLTAKVQENDKIEGLSSGADDYMTKPFSINELLARVEAVLRRVRPSNSSETVIHQGRFVLDNKARRVMKNNDTLDLTQVEYLIMEFFFKNPGTALNRETILNAVWGENYYGDVKIVDVNIRRLRMKVEDDPSKPAYIQTVWGYGYRWSAE
ncbi:MAG: response regulator transcription factor [Oscillospiraceae bacterium]|nr:response regulator transcription factor [Oscillospiraceae bacterium]